MDKLLELFIHRSRPVFMVLLLIVFAGFQAYKNIPKEREPSVQIPIIYVSMVHEGISPEDAERLLIRPMEKELRSVEGVKEVTAHAVEGQASVTLEFTAGFDSSKALNDVREKVDIAKAELPQDTEEPSINEVNLSLFPVLNVVLRGDLPEAALLQSARHLRDKIEGLSNVLEVKISGDREEVLELVVDPAALQSYNIQIESLASISQGFNKLIAAGALQEKHGRYAVKVPGLIEDLDDLLSIPIKHHEGAVVTVNDIAEVRKTYKDATEYARVNGKGAMVLEVSKRTGTNIIETIEQVRAVVLQEKSVLPPNLLIDYTQDRSARILDMLSDLQNNIILATFLVLVVVVYFVGFRSGLLVSLAIPGAFLFSLLVLSQMGLTLNIVVLFSLILSVGMLVDAAIIVCEMAERKISEGLSHKKAYLVAAQYMKWPIIASTVTTLVVFMPLLSWPGTVGKFMQYLPITLIITLTGSLLMALIFIPAVGTAFGRPAKLDQKVIDRLYVMEHGDLSTLGGFYGGYYRWLTFALNNAGKSALVMLGVLISVYTLYGFLGSGVQFFPKIEPDSSMVQIRARGNLSPLEKNAISKEVEVAIQGLEGEVRAFYARAGGSGRGGGKQSDDVIGVINLEYGYWQNRRKAEGILADIKQRTAHIDGILISTKSERGGPQGDKAVEIEIGSYFPELIEPVVEKVLVAMSKVGGFRDIEDSRPIPMLEWEFDVNRELSAQYETDTNTVGRFITLATHGLKLTDYRPDESDDEVDIVVRFPAEKRSIDTLDSLTINTSQGAVPIGNFVERKAVRSIKSINRSDGMRVMEVKADVERGMLPADLLKKLQATLESDLSDPRVRIRLKGDDKDQKEASAFLQNAFIFAIFIMALVLVAQFNSVYYMVVILSAIVFSTVGVLLALIITGQPFGIVMCGVGVISLSGIVVNNNIIFIDTYLKFRDEGMESHEALIRTGVQRIRPILLTAGTTVLGLLPMVLAMNIDFVRREVVFGAPSSQWWEQLATSIAGGLTFATLLTLFFTPSLIKLGERYQIGRVYDKKEGA
jgi:multidrug efflux pump